jgi:hypothetical protein
MGYGANVASARRAVDYVTSKMTVGASNRVDVLKTGGGSVLCVFATRQTDFAVAERNGIPSYILLPAATAEHVGCGNCGEQAALAFVYLVEDLKVKPVEYMGRTNADHAFVVIGRSKDSDVSDYKTWGDQCVVCDPWDKKSFAASQIPKEAYKPESFQAESIFRLD